MVFDGKGLGFCVKMVGVGHLHTGGGNSEGGVLEGSQFVDVGRGSVGEPDGGSVCDL